MLFPSAPRARRCSPRVLLCAVVVAPLLLGFRCPGSAPQGADGDGGAGASAAQVGGGTAHGGSGGAPSSGGGPVVDTSSSVGGSPTCAEGWLDCDGNGDCETQIVDPLQECPNLVEVASGAIDVFAVSPAHSDPGQDGDLRYWGYISAGQLFVRSVGGDTPIAPISVATDAQFLAFGESEAYVGGPAGVTAYGLVNGGSAPRNVHPWAAGSEELVGLAVARDGRLVMATRYALYDEEQALAFSEDAFTMVVADWDNRFFYIDQTHGLFSVGLDGNQVFEEAEASFLGYNAGHISYLDGPYVFSLNQAQDATSWSTWGAPNLGPLVSLIPFTNDVYAVQKDAIDRLVGADQQRWANVAGEVMGAGWFVHDKLIYGYNRGGQGYVKTVPRVD